MILCEFPQPLLILTKLTASECFRKNSSPASSVVAVAADEKINELSLRRSGRKRTGRRILQETSEFEEDWKNNDEDEEYDDLKERTRNVCRRRQKNRLPSETSRNSSENPCPYKCSQCPAHFKMKAHLKSHTDHVHGAGKEETFTCPICERMMTRLLTLFSHVKRHENAEECEEAFDLWNQWPQPKNCKRKLSGGINFSCKYCLLPLSSHQSFVSHMASHHPERGRASKFPCTFCKETSEFDSINRLMAHIRQDHYEEYHRCETKVVEWSESTSSAGRPRPKACCKICGKLLDAWGMKGHLRRHAALTAGAVQTPRRSDTTQMSAEEIKLYPYECPFPTCNRRSKTPQLLKAHFILHLKNNPYACPVPGCTVKCDARCHLERHLKLHQQGNFHTCEKCGVAYSRIDKLRSHVCSSAQRLRQDDKNGVVRPLTGNLRLERLPEMKGKVSDVTKQGKVPRTDLNGIMRTDPVFIQACKDSPGFGELLGVTKGVIQPAGNEWNIKVSTCTSGGWNWRKPSKCTECGKILSGRTSLRRHWQLVHGITLPPMEPAATRKGSNKRKRSSKKQQTVKCRNPRNHDNGVSSSKGGGAEVGLKINELLVKVEPELFIEDDHRNGEYENISINGTSSSNSPPFLTLKHHDPAVLMKEEMMHDEENVKDEKMDAESFIIPDFDFE